MMHKALTAAFAATSGASQRRLPAPLRRRRSGRPVKRISLALQGGGAHGAFTWGVLDHLLEDGRIAIAGVSGTSAGAVNAIMLADGLARGGPDEARRRLADFWRATSLGGELPRPQRAVVDRMLSLMPGPSPMQALVRGMSRYLSPYDFNPLNINPLKDLIARAVDFDAVRDFDDLELFISATNVHTGEPRIFTRDEITADVVMASAALPLLFRAVEIDGVPYWDGGYGANPAILPLARAAGGADVLVVQISPVERRETPNSSQQIVDRINEITFNASLAAELKTFGLIGQLIDDGCLKPGDGYRPVNLHRIALDGGPQLTPASRLNTDYEFLETLHHTGRAAAQSFLEEHFDDIGVRGTIEMEKVAA
jgi:NTE family protein